MVVISSLLVSFVAFLAFASAKEPENSLALNPNFAHLASRDTCSSPPLRSRTFYSDCLEKHFQCGLEGYPIGYGFKYCTKFSTPENLARFSQKGQAWMWSTMHCLQLALVPELQLLATSPGACDSLEEKAFDTHASCYVSSGLCTLPPSDWLVIVDIVGLSTLFGSWDALKESLEASGGCFELFAWIIERKLKEGWPF
ncbi:hypothetical protein Moror_13940 [Moniliophthora roreri MCA 2997]|uniref:Uncharacterized protein n=2 Tax=Moniliophthora roreri TaxID=221103 RepID=V2XR77_MONRO|nr:hypothetical protein Moror_13940 [Moniliophthora roreri MCA 2997]